jgi:hypothetical protein
LYENYLEVVELGKIASQTDKAKEINLLKFLKTFYQKIRFMALNSRDRPFILANSQHVDEQVRERVKQIGFDGCLDNVLGPQ